MNETLKKRLLSLAWRAGAAAIIAGLAVISGALPDLGLPEMATGVVVLVINEVTKHLNNQHKLGKAEL